MTGIERDAGDCIGGKQGTMDRAPIGGQRRRPGNSAARQATVTLRILGRSVPRIMFSRLRITGSAGMAIDGVEQSQGLQFQAFREPCRRQHDRQRRMHHQRDSQ